MAAIQMNKEMFDWALAGDKPVLVDYWAPWCTYCRKITDAYEQIAQEYGEDIIVAKINIDDEEQLAIEQQIELIPTLIIYKNGRAEASVVAPESKAAIDAFIADTLGVREEKRDEKVYDMVVIGGGPAGYTAALYAARSGLETIVLERLSAGGQMALTHQIDNYPGFEEGVDGYTLGQKMRTQAERFGAKTEIAEVLSVDLAAMPKAITTNLGTIYGRTVVIATGANPRELGVEQEREMIGRGVNYCAACDGMFYKGKTVVVVGGGNSAAADAALLSRIAEKVIVVHRRDTLRATKVYHQPLMEAKNVEFRWNRTVDALLYGDKLYGLRLRDVHTGETEEIACDGLFISVGRQPATKLFEGQITLDGAGYIMADETTRTNIPGVFAAGDVRTKALRQVVTAVADGAAAVHHAEEYLAGMKA
ncbi:MAG: thioredoxin-disulfide reductase [Clostridia bacterium]|nr:thioredoxin-disulfide reductase [Clostridia bacterium]